MAFSLKISIPHPRRSNNISFHAAAPPEHQHLDYFLRSEMNCRSPAILYEGLMNFAVSSFCLTEDPVDSAGPIKPH